MSRELKPITDAARGGLWSARELLRQALALAKAAGAVRSIPKIRRAIKSVDGAMRHASRRPLIP